MPDEPQITDPTSPAAGDPLDSPAADAAREGYIEDFDASVFDLEAALDQAVARFIMLDTVDATQIPAGFTGPVAYYADGRWANLGRVRARCPHSLLLPIVVFAHDPAPGTLKQYWGYENGIECDCERTDLTPQEVGPWAKNVKSQGGVPHIYVSLSELPAAVASCAAAGLKRADVKIRTAHWTNTPHICSGIATVWGLINADATQFTDHYQGHVLDASLCEPDFLASAPAPPVTKPAQGRRLITLQYNANPPHGNHWAIVENKALDWAPGSEPAEASMELQVNHHTSEVRVVSMKQDAPPLGGASGPPPPPPPPQVHYVNPVRDIQSLRPERIDMGVDFAGAGPLLAIGNALVELAISGPESKTGWPGGVEGSGVVRLLLTDGPYAGRRVLYAENIQVLVKAGDHVKAGQAVAILRNVFPNCELGWASGNFTQPLARALNQQQPPPHDPGGWISASGASFENLIVSLGAPKAPNYGGLAHGRMPAGYPPVSPSKSV